MAPFPQLESPAVARPATTVSHVTVGLMGPADAARWDAFVLACPEATFFHRAGWRNVIEQAFGHPCWFMYGEIDGRIQAVLPLAQVRSRWFGNALISLPFCVYGGIASSHADAARAVDAAAQQLARRLRVDHLEYRHLRQASHAGAGASAGAGAPWREQDLYVTFHKPLLPTVEQNMLAIPRKQRAMVRKGASAGLRSVVDNDIDRFFHCYADSVHRLGTPVFSRRYFSLLQREFGPDCELLHVLHGQDSVCSVLSFHFRDQVLPYYGGGGAAARALAGNDFMYWEVMRRACERGSRLFDFGRSKRGTGACDFKKNWGFEAQPLAYAYQLHQARRLPAINPLNPRYRLLIQAWRKLPLAWANVLGPHIVRQLG